MTSNDILFFQHCYSKGWVQNGMLDIGSSTLNETQTSFGMIAKDWGLSNIKGVDISAGSGVDIVFDFSIDDSEFEAKWGGEKFNTVVIFNVLEHTFDPYQVLRNASRCLRPGGFLLAVVPTIWPIHSFPKDHCRLLPDWFEEFSKRENLDLIREGFLWLSQFGLARVDGLTQDQERTFPSFHNLGKQSQPLRYWISKISHKVLNTFGRNHLFSHVALGVVFQKPLELNK